MGVTGGTVPGTGFGQDLKRPSLAQEVGPGQQSRMAFEAELDQREKAASDRREYLINELSATEAELEGIRNGRASMNTPQPKGPPR
jgi:hypothetical protein